MTFGLPQRLLAAGALCLAALVALVVTEGRARAAGTEVILDMEPVDPRSLLTGHYVMLNFAQALHQGEKCPPIDESSPTPFGRPRDTWVALKRVGERHVVSGVAHTRANAARLGELTVRGMANCNEATPPVPDNPSSGMDGAVRLSLAIDRFHIDQAQAEAIDKAVRDRSAGEARVAAIVSVGADGTPRTKGLIVDGQRIELTWW